MILKHITWISKQYPHFYAFYWFFMCCFPLFIHFFILQPLSRKVTFSGTQKSTQTVFNLQASDWVYCKEETGVYYQLSRNSYKLIIFFLQILKLFCQKNMHFQKIPNFYFFFQNEIIGHMYICTKCNGNFKFLICLKS